MRKAILYSFVLVLLLFSAIAELPPAPPPAPGGFAEQPAGKQLAEPETAATASASTITTDASVPELQEKISALEKEISALKASSGIRSTPFIISVSINITLIIIIFYLLKKSKEQSPQF